jgi:hypothetical protein
MPIADGPGPSSHSTRRWRKPDSNRWYRLTRPSFIGAARFRSPPYRSAGCRTENRPAARANRRPACRGPYHEASWGGSAGSSPSQTGHPSGQQHPLVQPKVRAVCLPCPHKPARYRYVPKGETDQLPPKRHIDRVWLIPKRPLLHPLIVRPISHVKFASLHASEDRQSTGATPSNPPKWWITLWKKHDRRRLTMHVS